MARDIGTGKLKELSHFKVLYYFLSSCESSALQPMHLARVKVTLPVSSSIQNMTGTPRVSSHTVYLVWPSISYFTAGIDAPSIFTAVSCPPPMRTCSIFPESGRIIVLERRKASDHGLAG